MPVLLGLGVGGRNVLPTFREVSTASRGLDLAQEFLQEVCMVRKSAKCTAKHPSLTVANRVKR